MKKVFLIVTVFLAFNSLASNSKVITKNEYIDMWSRTAMDDMIIYKIPASITLAQGILESGSGNSDLARLANNHFGIKCHTWTGDKVFKDDDTKNECFRKYPTAALSFKDHSDFLTGSKRYSNLFSLEMSNYKAWARGLKDAGYATNPKYPSLLIDLIEALELYKYDELVLNKPNKSSNILVKKQDKTETTSKTSSENQSVKAKPVHHKQNTTQEVEVVIGKTRETFLHANKVKYVIAKNGDTYYKIAEEFSITLGQIQKYNDVKNGNAVIKEGDIINIFPKSSKGKNDLTSYSEDLTILQIAQREGIKVKSLMKLNDLSSSKVIIKKGQKVTLR